MKSRYRILGILDGDELRLDGATIGVEAGFIESVKNEPPEGRWKKCIAMPGLIQSHIHLGQTLFRGMAEGRTLLPWLSRRIWPLEAAHTMDTLAVSVIVSLRELLASGCIGLLDMGVLKHSEVTVDILRRTGIRALAGNAIMDTGPQWTTADISWLKEESGRVRSSCGDLVDYVFAPRFALSCSDSIWRWLSGLPPGTRRTTHAGEADAELSDPAIRSAGGNIKFLRDRGFLGPDTLLVHCVHLQSGETGILEDSGATVVHCPWANLRLGSGIANIPELAGRKINVTLGSDGAACNNRLDLSGDLRLAMGLAAVSASPSSLSTGYWLRCVTSAAAKVMGWKDTGILREGYSADIVFLEPTEQEWEELTLAEDPLRYILELNWPARVRMTMVRGRILYQDGDYPTLPPMPSSIADSRRAVYQRAESRIRDTGQN